MRITEILGIELPIIQAPMAGVSTPEMAAAVSNAGALGSIGVGSSLWLCLAKSYGRLLGARVLNGFATAVNESPYVFLSNSRHVFSA